MGGKSEKADLERRRFLKTAGIAAAGAATAAQIAPTEAQATESAPERVKARYQETEHVRRFYALNRWVSGV